MKQRFAVARDVRAGKELYEADALFQQVIVRGEPISLDAYENLRH